MKVSVGVSVGCVRGFGAALFHAIYMLRRISLHVYYAMSAPTDLCTVLHDSMFCSDGSDGSASVASITLHH